MSIAGSTHNAKAEEAVQRFEIFTDWSEEEKARIVIVARCRSARLRGGIACRPVAADSP